MSTIFRFRSLLHHLHKLITAFPYSIQYIFKNITEVSIIGPNISLEASSMCQLKCPICPTSRGINKTGPVGWGYLKFKDYKNFVVKNPAIKNIELSNWGEIFLNPELKHILRYSYEKKKKLTVLSGSNLNDVKKDILESLVKYKLRFLNISIDGATNKTYKIYRQGGDHNRVIANIKLINHFKKKYKSKYPKLLWQFVIMGHNEHELLKAKKFSQQLGMRFYSKLNWNSNFSPIKNKKFVKKESKLGVTSRVEFFNKYKKIYKPTCMQFWSSPQVNWDGKLLGCCDNIWSDFGNVFTFGLEKCLKSEKYVYTKKVLLGKTKLRADIPCSNCSKYKFIQKKPIKKIDIITKFNLY